MLRECVWRHYNYSHFTNEKPEAENGIFLAHHCHFIPGPQKAGVTLGPKLYMVVPRALNIQYVSLQVFVSMLLILRIHKNGLKILSTFCIFGFQCFNYHIFQTSVGCWFQHLKVSLFHMDQCSIFQRFFTLFKLLII